MARVRVPLNNFQFGEVSPALTSRTDTRVYTNAAEEVRNFFIRSEGGLKKELELNAFIILVVILRLQH